MGWNTLNAFDEIFGPNGTLGREHAGEVFLTRYLFPALKKLNPTAPAEAIDEAVNILTSNRSVMSLAAANREVYALLKNGIKVEIKSQDGSWAPERIRIIDWDNPEKNDFLLVSQLWVTGEMYKRRPDLVGFVNGLPFIVCEFKAVTERLETAFKDNITDYKNTIPQLFLSNAFIIVSNGHEGKLGSLTAQWEHYCDWKKINSESESGSVSLETVLRGTCDKHRLLDLVENFTLFEEANGHLRKIVAKNHQYIGVQNAIKAGLGLKKNQGRLGVFWQTQGAGKSYSMVFFAQKVLRKIPGNWTFVGITDRLELDNQLYKNFANVGAVSEPEERVRADSAEHLKQLLTEDHRYVFTLIQKFRTERGGRFPKLSDRSDIIVMTDEAHRTQYDIFAMNMRDALPHAAFIGFTGTPLIVGEEKTKEVFGDYVSIYDFKQSVDDGATVPLFYENRIPELQLTNEHLTDDIYAVIEAAELDEEQEKKLERLLSKQYHLLTREDRLNKVAEDLVRHFSGRGFKGKGMVVCIDKLTAVRMYDKVKARWKTTINELKATKDKTTDAEKENEVQAQIEWMESTDMAVVVSQAQNEAEEFRKKGVDIVPHRRRMVMEDMDKKFKDEDDPFRLVFVCAMWMTGFDVPSCSTIYLDKPLRNHTLMQTIARANRVFKDKVNGLIVDYVGVFRDLQKALSIYAGSGGGATPVKEKAALIQMLKSAIKEATEFCKEHGVDVNAIMRTKALERIKALDDARAAILINDDSKKKFLSLAGRTTLIYRAILPDAKASEFVAPCALFATLAEMIQSLMPFVDISVVLTSIETVLDKSIGATGYQIKDGAKYLDLSKIDFDVLRKFFKTSKKQTEIERLRRAIEEKLHAMVERNRTRTDFLEEFQRLIDAYNAGSANVDKIFDELVKFAEKLNEEEKRHIREQLSEEELAVFDILTKPRMNMTPKEESQVKKVAREMMGVLKAERLVLDWRKKQQTRASVRLCVEESLDRLPPAYTPEVYKDKCSAVYQFVYDNYVDATHGTYYHAQPY